MNKIKILLALVFVSSCAHVATVGPQEDARRQITTDRMPNAQDESDYKLIQQCGRISYGESNYSALNAEDVMYNLALDCNNDRAVDKKDQFLSVGFPVSTVTPIQKGWITRWTKASVRKAKAIRKAPQKPYVCVKFQALANPCETQKSVIGYNPKFTSLAKASSATKK